MKSYECITLSCKNQIGVKGEIIKIKCLKCGGTMQEQPRTVPARRTIKTRIVIGKGSASIIRREGRNTSKAKSKRNKGFPYRKSSGKDKSRSQSKCEPKKGVSQ